MSRVEAAIQEGRCVLAFGARALQPDVLMELRRRSVPSVTLGADPVNPVGALSAEVLAPLLAKEGGALVLIEPDAADGRGLNVLAEIIAKSTIRPKLYVAAKAFNPFVLPMALRLLKLEQIKEKARDFVAGLPVGAPVAAANRPVAAPVAAKPAKAPRERDQEKEKEAAAGQRQAPRPVFVGREEEIAAFSEMLGTDGGPITVVGAPGIGKRWLVERVLAESKLSRLADFTLGRGVGADALLGRIASIAHDAGDDALSTALRNPDTRSVPVDLAAEAARCLQNPALAGKVWVIHDLHRAQDRRDGSLHRMGRLELVLKALLTTRPALRIVFTSSLKVAFYREGEATNIRVVELAGIRGKELYQIFKNHHVEDTPRDRFGPIADRTLGHPMLVRALALEVAGGADLDELLKAPRFLKIETLGDLEPLRRHLKRKVEGLDEPTRKALAIAAHLREPGTANELQQLGVSRNDRINLLSIGMLEQTPALEDRRFYVHPLVREHLEFQETSNFDLMEGLGNYFLDLANDRAKARSSRLAWLQEGHRLLVESRRLGRNFSLPYPDHDALIESIMGLMRRKQPRLDIARARINEGLKADPKNTELLLADAELKAEEKAGPEAVAAAFARAAEVAPTPEVFHTEAGHHLDKNARGKAVSALERGIQIFPTDARLYRRVANLYLKQNRVDDAIAALRQAMELEPMMPDAYGMLGEVFVGRGPSMWAEAATFIDEALRLEPDHPSHLLRLATLRRAQGMLDPETRAEKWAEAVEKLKVVVQADPENARAHALLCALLLDVEGGDLDQAEWLAKKAMKIVEAPETLVQRARVLIRRAAFEDAERLLEKAIKKDGAYHPAFAGRAELLMAQGQVFVAFENLKKARERTAKDAPERAIYETEMAQLSALIESGAAADLLKQAEAAGIVPVGMTSPEEAGPRRDSSTSVRRRRRGGRDNAAQAGSDEASSSDDTTSSDEPTSDEEISSSDDASQAEDPETRTDEPARVEDDAPAEEDGPAEEGGPAQAEAEPEA